MAVAAGQRRPFYDHVVELRTRLLYVVVFFALASGVTYFWHSDVISILQRPLGQPLFYGTPSGGFQLLMQVCMLGGLIGALPAILFHVARFIEPALEKNISGLRLFGVVVLSLILLACGLVFGFLIILPTALHFFTSFSSADVKPLITTDAYFGFVISILATFAILFQLPLLLLLINFFTPLKPGKMMSYFRFVVLGSFVLALILPFTYDPLTQALMAAPIIILYLLSVILIWIANRPKRQKRVKKVAAPKPKSVLQQTPAPVVAPPTRPRPVPNRVIDLRNFDAHSK